MRVHITAQDKTFVFTAAAQKDADKSRSQFTGKIAVSTAAAGPG